MGNVATMLLGIVLLTHLLVMASAIDQGSSGPLVGRGSASFAPLSHAQAQQDRHSPASAETPGVFVQTNERTQLSRGALKKLQQQISGVLALEKASRNSNSNSADAAASASLTESGATATATGEDAGLPADMSLALNENPTPWWPGRTAMSQALNEQGSTISGMASAPEPAAQANNPHMPGGPAGLWWLKNAPWFLPPPPEWGPIKPEMYANYYYKPVKRNYMLPNVQQRSAPWYAPNTDADGSASHPQLPAAFPGQAGAAAADGGMGVEGQWQGILNAAAGLPSNVAAGPGNPGSLFAPGAAAPGGPGGDADALYGHSNFAGITAPGAQPSGPIGAGTDGVVSPPFRGMYASDLSTPLPTETLAGPSPSLTAAAFAAGLPGSDGKPYSAPLSASDNGLGPVAAGAVAPPLAVSPGGIYAMTGNQLTGAFPGAATGTNTGTGPYAGPAASAGRGSALLQQQQQQGAAGSLLGGGAGPDSPYAATMGALDSNGLPLYSPTAYPGGNGDGGAGGRNGMGGNGLGDMSNANFYAANNYNPANSNFNANPYADSAAAGAAGVNSYPADRAPYNVDPHAAGGAPIGGDDASSNGSNAPYALDPYAAGASALSGPNANNMWQPQSGAAAAAAAAAGGPMVVGGSVVDYNTFSPSMAQTPSVDAVTPQQQASFALTRSLGPQSPFESHSAHHRFARNRFDASSAGPSDRFGPHRGANGYNINNGESYGNDGIRVSGDGSSLDDAATAGNVDAALRDPLSANFDPANWVYSAPPGSVLPAVPDAGMLAHGATGVMGALPSPGALAVTSSAAAVAASAGVPDLLHGGAALGGGGAGTYRDTAAYLVNGPGAAIGLPSVRTSAHFTGLQGMVGAPQPFPDRPCPPGTPEGCGGPGMATPGSINQDISTGGGGEGATGTASGTGKAGPYPGLAPWFQPDPTKELDVTGEQAALGDPLKPNT